MSVTFTPFKTDALEQGYRVYSSLAGTSPIGRVIRRVQGTVRGSRVRWYAYDQHTQHLGAYLTRKAAVASLMSERARQRREARERIEARKPARKPWAAPVVAQAEIHSNPASSIKGGEHLYEGGEVHVRRYLGLVHPSWKTQGWDYTAPNSPHLGTAPTREAAITALRAIQAGF